MRSTSFISSFPRKLLLVVLLSITYAPSAFAQCIDRKKIDWSEDGLFYNYGYLCPAYFFSYGGDTSKKWNIGFANIDIRQAPPNALKFKEKVDQTIKNHAGGIFFRNLKFNNVEVCYPEKLKAFKDSGAVLATLAHYKCRYTYSYSFEPDSLTGYNICVGVTSSGQIITPLIFPSKRFYKPINNLFTYCHLIEIARKAQKNIDPIDKISFNYDKKKKIFYWLISQALVNEHEGGNDINEVFIDAADFSKVRAVKSTVYVMF